MHHFISTVTATIYIKASKKLKMLAWSLIWDYSACYCDIAITHSLHNNNAALFSFFLESVVSCVITPHTQVMLTLNEIRALSSR